MADGHNDRRMQRVAELLEDFHTLQHYIASTPSDPDNGDDYYTEGWAQLRQCSIDGQNILNCAMDPRLAPTSRHQAENDKAQLRQDILDAFCRRHRSQLIYERQGAVQTWILMRENVLQGMRPQPGHAAQLAACDRQLRTDLASLTDEVIYSDLQNSDRQHGRWTREDPSLRHVQRWLQSRR